MQRIVAAAGTAISPCPGQVKAVVEQPFVPTRAFDILAEARSSLTIVAAPAGYGKTSLLDALSRALVADGRRVQWRSLDDCVREAVAATPDTGSGPEIVFIDDAHLCDPRQVARFFRTVATAPHDRRATRYIVATRTLPDLDWLSWQAQGHVTLLRVQDLALDEGEAGRLLHAYAGFVPTADTVSTVLAWSEGWPIAIQLYAIVARRRGEFLRSAAIGAGTSGDLFRFLSETLYADLDDGMRGFLTAVGDLDRFNPRMLCDLLGATAASLLTRALSENLMLVPARCGGDWVRMHGVFRAFIGDCRLRLDQPVDRSLLARAADWCEREGAAGDAIDYRLRIGDVAAAERTLIANAPSLLQNNGEILRTLRWVERIERDLGTVAIPLRLWRTWALVLTQHLPAAEAELASIVLAMPATAPTEWQAHRDRLFISIAAQAGRTADVVALTAQWLTRWGQSEPFHAAAVSALRALALHRSGADIASRREIGSARRYARDPGCRYARCWVVVIEALLEIETGRVGYAVESIERALAEAATSRDTARSMIGLMRVVAARAYAERGDSAVAQRYLIAGQADGATHGIVETAIALVETSAMLVEQDAGVDAALVEYRHAAMPGERFAREIALRIVHLLLRNGRVEEADRTFHSEFPQDTPGDDPETARAQAWLYFAQGRPTDALALASEHLPLVESSGRNIACTSLFLLCAAAHHQLGDRRRSAQYWSRGIRLAAERNLRRTAIDHAWAVAPLLASADACDGFAPEAIALIAAMRARAGVATVAAATVCELERLTPREAEVLRLLDTGMTSEMLAERIKLGQSTTKWHIKNIYAKLGVHNRSGALARARQLALI